MRFRHTAEPAAPSPAKKPGRSLLWETLVFFLVYALCSLGSLLVMIVLSEWLFLPLLGDLTNSGAAGNSAALMEEVLSSPYLMLMMLFSTVSTIAVVILFCRCIQKRSWDSMGLSRKGAFLLYLRGILLGGIAISLAVAACAAAGGGSFRNADPASVPLILLFGLAYLIQGASEELLCRGYFMYSVARRYPMWLAVGISSVFFALLHLSNSGVSMTAFLNLFLFGVFSALITIRTGSVWYASGFHSAWNFFQGNFYGIKVSGMDMNSSVLHFVSDPSRAYLNGGDFGMEGSFLCTVLLTLCILLTLRRSWPGSHVSHS